MRTPATVLAVVCVVVASVTIRTVPVRPAPSGGVDGCPPAHECVAILTPPALRFDIATLEFEQQPGIRARATLSWSPGHQIPHPTFGSVIVDRGFWLRLEPVTSRNGWSVRSEERLVSHELPISRRLEDGPSRPTGGLAWDARSGSLVILTGDSTTHGMALVRTAATFVAVGDHALGPASLRTPDAFSLPYTSFQIPGDREDRFGVGSVRYCGDEIILGLAPWAACDLGVNGIAPRFRVRLSRDFGRIIGVEPIGLAPRAD